MNLLKSNYRGKKFLIPLLLTLGFLGVVGCVDAKDDEAGEIPNASQVCSSVTGKMLSCLLISEGDVSCSVLEIENESDACFWNCFATDGTCSDFENIICDGDEFSSGVRSCVANCENSAEEYVCGSGETIPLDWVCDGMDDCDDASDEMNCSGNTSNVFECANGDTIPQDWVCDMEDDCGDNSDETNCSVTNGQMFQCNDGSQIPADYECDFEEDCEDASDEHMGCSVLIHECTP